MLYAPLCLALSLTRNKCIHSNSHYRDCDLVAVCKQSNGTGNEERTARQRRWPNDFRCQVCSRKVKIMFSRLIFSRDRSLIKVRSSGSSEALGWNMSLVDWRSELTELPSWRGIGFVHFLGKKLIGWGASARSLNAVPEPKPRVASDETRRWRFY